MQRRRPRALLAAALLLAGWCSVPRAEAKGSGRWALRAPGGGRRAPLTITAASASCSASGPLVALQISRNVDVSRRGGFVEVRGLDPRAAGGVGPLLHRYPDSELVRSGQDDGRVSFVLSGDADEAWRLRSGGLLVMYGQAGHGTTAGALVTLQEPALVSALAGSDDTLGPYLRLAICNDDPGSSTARVDVHAVDPLGGGPAALLASYRGGALIRGAQGVVVALTDKEQVDRLRTDGLWVVYGNDRYGSGGPVTAAPLLAQARGAEAGVRLLYAANFTVYGPAQFDQLAVLISSGLNTVLLSDWYSSALQHQPCQDEAGGSCFDGISQALGMLRRGPGLSRLQAVIDLTGPVIDFAHACDAGTQCQVPEQLRARLAHAAALAQANEGLVIGYNLMDEAEYRKIPTRFLEAAYRTLRALDPDSLHRPIFSDERFDGGDGVPGVSYIDWTYMDVALIDRYPRDAGLQDQSYRRLAALSHQIPVVPVLPAYNVSPPLGTAGDWRDVSTCIRPYDLVAFDQQVRDSMARQGVARDLAGYAYFALWPELPGGESRDWQYDLSNCPAFLDQVSAQLRAASGR